MTGGRNLEPVQAIILFSGLAQALFWISTGFMRNGLLPFDLVFFWLTVPTIGLGLLGQSLPLAAGLAVAGLIINLGLLAAFAA